ncbi:hypothetical protein Gogos_005498 [Gossypium gossypioides]|uniref:R13L1/DRL21-like LRR repeat region domain-containing protein n=1 Tax=Gossypium gossypioides TaxID=34282 RepID=A0A7J9D0S4_GOSGO|nr:hypothetical protein [Gossypium gossypioides]
MDTDLNLTHTLPIFDVGKENGSGIKELGCLVELVDELLIYNLQNVRNIEEARAAKLWEKKKLQKLEYRWEFPREVLEGLEPHSNLKNLSIENYMGEYYPLWLLVSKTVGDPCASFQPMNLVELKLSRCMNLKHLLTLGQYPNLKFLEIRVLTSVRCIGNEFYGNNSNGDEKNQPITLFLVLESIPSVEGGVSFLQQLQVSYCDEIRKIGEGLLISSTCLRDVDRSLCPKLMSTSFNDGSQSLVSLRLKWCDELREIEGGLSADTSLETLEIECSRMISIPSLDGFSSLVELKLINCLGLTSLPKGSSTCTSLGCLSIRNCTSLESISEDVGQLHSLEELFIYRCQNLKKSPKESLGCLTRLKSLLVEFPGLSSIHHLHSSLKELHLHA